MGKQNECIHCNHPCHCGLLCNFYKQNEALLPHSRCKCDECNCRPPDWEPAAWGSATEYME